MFQIIAERLKKALSLTSDLVGDMLLGGDDLVHVCSYGGLQR